jgi:hypothetical protein
MAALRCSCGQGTPIWGEFWWVGGEHRWVFYDDEKTSESYAERITRCRGCGTTLEYTQLHKAAAGLSGG